MSSRLCKICRDPFSVVKELHFSIQRGSTWKSQVAEVVCLNALMHVALVNLRGSEALEIVRNSESSMGLDAW